ncbi:MAG: helix-turn-helix transcriptional regulator [Terriglobales bacterium]|jgi:DNA-binding CsgD family transcriptional regulator
MQPRDRLSAKEIQVASLVWQGLTNKDIAAVLRTSEQVVKNYLRTTFDKLGVWTRLELALYVASHGGANWAAQFGRAVTGSTSGWSATVADEGARMDESALLAEGKGKAAAASSGGTL